MFYLSDICLLCLTSKQFESVLMQNDNGITVQEELKYCLPEITVSKSEIPKFICSSCRTAVHSFYKFKKTCLENYSRLIQYTQILQGNNDLRGQKFSELKIQINNIDLMIEQEKVMNSALNVKVEIEDTFHSLGNHKQRTDNIDVKEEDDLICTELQKQLNQEFIRERDKELGSKLNIKIDNQVSLQSLNEPVLDDEFEVKEEFIASKDTDDHEFYLKNLKNELASENEQYSASRSSCAGGNQPNVDKADFGADTGNLTTNVNGEQYKHNDEDPFHQNSEDDSDYKPDSDLDLTSEDERIPCKAGAIESNESDLPNLEDNENSSDSSTAQDIPGKTSALENTQSSIVEIESCAQPVFLPKSTGKNDKQYFCVKCKSLVKKFARHIETQHNCDEEVKNILSFPKNSHQRKKLIDDLRNRGTFIYNTDIKTNTGDLIVTRRPQLSKKRKVRDYNPCPNCKGFYKKDSLHVHYKRCVNVRSAPRSLRAYSEILKQHISEVANNRMKNDIIPGMRSDEIKNAIIQDKLILQWGSRLCDSYSCDKYLTNFIRQKLRLLGRLLVTIRKIDKTVTDLASVIDAKKFNSFVKAVNIVGALDEETGVNKVPTVATELGTNIKKCAKILVSNYIKNDDEASKIKVENFLSVFEMDYSVIVSKTALKNRKRPHWNKPQHLPRTKDIKLFN